MRSHDTHTIRREIFEFRCADASHAFPLKQQMEDAVEMRVLAVMDHVLNECPPEASLHLDVVEIDLGELAFDDLARELPARFETRFREKMQAAVKAPPASAQAAIRHAQRADYIIEAFLLTGSLPWWCDAAGEFDLPRQIAECAHQHPEAMRTLLTRHAMNETFLRRLAYQGGPAAWSILLEMLPAFGAWWRMLEARVRHVLNPGFAGAPAAEFQQQLITVAMRLKPYDVDTGAARGNEFVRVLAEVFGAAAAVPHRGALAGAILPNTEEEFVDACRRARAEGEPGEPITLPVETPEASGEKIFIRNAGMVLLAAFLPAFYKELGWTRDGTFVDLQARHKALFMLHYLCTGDLAAPEYTLPLNKILTGIPLEDPVPARAELDARERQEAMQLLEDVKTHWAPLANSSVEGLQGTFLLREGLLSFGNGRWLLQIERKGCDVLLDSIPWAWHTIKLDWMETYVEAEW